MDCCATPVAESSSCPAFDIPPTMQGLGYQGMDVGTSGSETTIENAPSRPKDFGMLKSQARDVMREVPSSQTF